MKDNRRGGRGGHDRRGERGNDRRRGGSKIHNNERVLEDDGYYHEEDKQSERPNKNFIKKDYRGGRGGVY